MASMAWEFAGDLLVMDLRAAYEGRRILVTGAAGFMGSHLVERLLDLGGKVTVHVRYTSRASMGSNLNWLAPVRSRLEGVLTGDLIAPDAIDQIAAVNAEIVLHLAADAWVTRSLTSPADVFLNNVQSTLNVLNAARRSANMKQLVITSSSEIYGTAMTERIDEMHPLEPTSPYAASKVACDRLAIAWHRTFGTPISVIRPFNTYGPRHTYGVIPKFIRSALRGERIFIHGTGEQSRDFTYVTDMVEAFLLMGAHSDAIGRVVNFGTGTNVSINTLAAEIIALTETKSEIVYIDDRKAQVHRLCCDPSLAEHLLGWKAAVSLRQGIARNVEWARQHERS